MTEELKQKGSFVPKEGSQDNQQESEREIIPPEVSLMLIYGKLSAILDELKALNGIFSKVKQEPITATPVTTVTTTTPITVTTSPAQNTKPVSNRILEIRKTLEEFKDLLLIDEETSTLSVIVRPKQFLGAENFSKIASAIRGIGGQYVSAGKNSHFEISKAELKKQ